MTSNFCDDDTGSPTWPSAADGAACVDPSRYACVCGDEHRFAALDGPEDGASEVHVKLAGAPEPTVVGQVYQHVRLLALLLKFVDLAADEVRQDVFIADVGAESDATHFVNLGPFSCRDADR